MNDIINLCSSALIASTAALKNTSSNLANMNTAGFRGSRMSFANLFDSGSSSNNHVANGGVSATVAGLNLKPGGYVSTGNNLDLAVLGAGFFVLKDAKGELQYTRNGQFQMHDNKLVAGDGSVVQAMGQNGLEDFSYQSSMVNAGVATTAISFTSGFSTLNIGQPVGTPYSAPVTVFDSSGGSHALTLQFTRKTGVDKDPISSNQWDVKVLDGGVDIGSPNPPFVLKFGKDGKPLDDGAAFAFSYTPSGLNGVDVKVNCGNIQSVSASSSSVTVVSDGQAGGTLQLNNLTFDESGTLQLNYTNGKKAQGPTIALAMADESSDWVQSGLSRFTIAKGGHVSYGKAGEEYGTISPGQLEGSNVDVTQEFSDLIVAQRMYQSASQMIQATSTLNDALLRAAGGH